MRSTLFVTSLLFAAVMACGGKSGGSKGPGVSQLQVIELLPTKGAPGEPITIKGEGFMTESRAVTVFFGDAQAQVIDIPSDTEVMIEAPAGEPGTSVDVVITFDPGGEIKLPHGYTFVAAAPQ
jgi:hypothetical protein